MIRTHVDASRSSRQDRSRLLGEGAGGRRQTHADTVMSFWRRIIESAVAEAKESRHGLPTYKAIAARYWLEEDRPRQSDREAWASSFECACSWLSLDVAKARLGLLAEIEMAQVTATIDYMRQAVYVRKAHVLTCGGVRRAIARQHVLGLVSTEDYEDVAGVVHAEPTRVVLQMTLRGLDGG